MKIFYYIHNGDKESIPTISKGNSLRDAIRYFEDHVQAERQKGTKEYKRSRLVVDSGNSVRVYQVGDRGGVTRSFEKQ